ncbi:MAG TPA: TVP38/TMEM64 family protein [Dissulfurispiraceae bacterium]|nr:TVP38/TMEM64 family protein [Dissulfurispiraceae bacterium]
MTNKRTNKRSNYSGWLIALIFIVIALPVGYVIYQSDLMQFFLNEARMRAFISSLGPWGPIGIILLQALQVVIAPIPGEATNILGGYLYGPLWGTLYSTIGVTVGSYLAFLFARIFGQPFVEKYASKALISRFDYLLHHKGMFIVFLIFLIPGTPKDSLCYLLGLGHLTSVEFLLLTGIGRLFGTFIETLGGDYLRNEQYQELAVLAGAILFVIFVIMIYQKKLEGLFRKWHKPRKPSPCHGSKKDER